MIALEMIPTFDLGELRILRLRAERRARLYKRVLLAGAVLTLVGFVVILIITGHSKLHNGKEALHAPRPH